MSSRPSSSGTLSRRVTIGDSYLPQDSISPGSLLRQSPEVARLFNDDEAEKRQRRKSTRDELLRRRSMLLTPTKSGGGPSSSAPSEEGTPRRSHLNVVNVATPNPKVPTLSTAQIYANYETWMKMATDGKINATNSWNFALIDYFHEMTFLREGDSVNFQKASVTLDGCVKIYTSRVDSVAVETGKLLTGLADSSKDEKAVTDGEGEAEEGEQKRKKRSHRAETTLARDFSQLMLKKFDLEFTVDPLFRKTSADFDEGGARGLLLNHLGVDRDCKIIFDASDATKVTDEELYQEENELTKDLPEVKKEPEEKDEGQDHMDIDAEGPQNNASDVQYKNIEKLDITKLRAKFLPSFQDISEKEICPSLKDFEFSSTLGVDKSWLKKITLDSPEKSVGHEDDGLDTFFDEGEGEGEGEDDGDGEGEGDDDIVGGGEYGADIDDGEDGFNPIDPSGNIKEKDFVMAVAKDETDMFSYFDTAFMKSWAGPEHWKLKRAIPKVKPVEEPEDPENPTAKSKKSKEVFQIDFTHAEDVDEEALFAQANLSTITMPVSRDKSDSFAARHLLPNDMHFSSKDLLQFFLKPKFTILSKKKTSQTPIGEPLSSAPVVEPDEEFWAVQPDLTQGQQGVDDANDADKTTQGAAMFMDDADDDDDEIDSYGDQLISQPLRKVKLEYVNYAKRAKKVDVKKLKENIWLRMTEVEEKSTPGQKRKKQVEPADEVQGQQKFSNVISSLSNIYPEDAMKDISVPFCFICLLHLANEKNLKITQADPEGLSELMVVQD